MVSHSMESYEEYQTSVGEIHDDGVYMFEEILLLRQKVHELEQENDRYKRQIEFKNDMLQQATSSMLSNEQHHNLLTRKITERFLEYKAKFAFYKDTKDTVHVHKDVSWRAKKKETDKMFNELTHEQKQMYIDKVIENLRS